MCKRGLIMYDNLDFKIRNIDAPNVDFLSETTNYLDFITGEHNFNGNRVISGILGNTINDNYFKIMISEREINIKNGSLCKYYLGDNFQTLGRGDTKRAIEKLSDTLHLPIDESIVTRLDIAGNFIVKQKIENYYNHLGELKNAKRSPVTNGSGNIEGLYYFKNFGTFLFYNKLKEQKDKGQPIPELYQDRNVLRIEQRYHKRLPQAFNIERVTASMLYDEKFYINLLNKWKENYFNIKKINDVTLNVEAMKTKTDLYNLGILALAEIMGGELNILSKVKESQMAGNIDKKQAFDLRQAITSACKEKVDITAKNDCILELDKKVVEAIKFYR